MCHSKGHTANRTYYPELIEALRETIRRLEANGCDELELRELQRNLFLFLSKLDTSESQPMAAD